MKSLGVFIENEAGSALKNIHNEKTFEHLETIKVAQKYPYPYGFILDTTAPDGDNIDVFVITKEDLKRGEIVECKIIGLMEQFEKAWDNPGKEEIDHNVIAVISIEPEIEIDEKVKSKLSYFVKHVFDNITKEKTRIGTLLSKKAAIKFISEHIPKINKKT